MSQLDIKCKHGISIYFPQASIWILFPKHTHTHLQTQAQVPQYVPHLMLMCFCDGFSVAYICRCMLKYLYVCVVFASKGQSVIKLRITIFVNRPSINLDSTYVGLRRLSVFMSMMVVHSWTQWTDCIKKNKFRNTWCT